jgi:hypothetical protein
MEPDSEPDIDLDEEDANKEQQKAEEETTKHIAALSARWRAEHGKRTHQIEKALLKERGQPTADERLIIGLASHDAGLAELLGEVELALTKRVQVLLDNVGLALKLARALREVSACREGTIRRVQSLLQTANVLQGQRQIAQVVPIRRVA